MRKLLLAVISIAFFSCAPDKIPADLLVINANIYTVDNEFSKASSFVVKDGKILEIGLKPELELKYFLKKTYDAKGYTILPGLIDAHAHLYGLGLSLQNVDLVGAKSFDEVIGRLAAFQAQKQVSYITGRGWNQNTWENKEFPTKHKLDSLFPDTPVALRRIDGHALLVNSKALELAGITADTKMDGGEVIVKDGEPTGVLVDSPMSLVNRTFPETSEEYSVNALLDAQERSEER